MPYFRQLPGGTISRFVIGAVISLIMAVFAGAVSVVICTISFAGLGDMDPFLTVVISFFVVLVTLVFTFGKTAA